MSVIICLMGPTATGKTDLALQLAQHLPIEIISVDSAMVYRGMDIGTAKPDKELLKKIPHYLIDICSPDEAYSAGQFRKDAVEAIYQIEKKHHIPLLAGGTMLYFRALQQGLSQLPAADENIRQAINQAGEEKGWKILYEKLMEIDPVTAKRLHPNDRQRIQRALEVYQITGTPLSQWHTHQKTGQEKYRFINIGLMPSQREQLKAKIEKRFLQMLDNGFIPEVEKLLSYRECLAMRAVGYRQISDYLMGKYSKDTMIQKAVIATRQLAKRQMTWLRSFPRVTFFESESSKIFEEVLSFLEMQKI
jgi:tRNA dimethylallyltransferase